MLLNRVPMAIIVRENKFIRMKKLVIVMAFVFGGFMVSNAQTANTNGESETPTVVSTTADATAGDTKEEKSEAKSKKSCAKATKSCAKASKKSCCSKSKKAHCSKSAAVKED